MLGGAYDKGGTPQERTTSSALSHDLLQWVAGYNNDGVGYSCSRQRLHVAGAGQGLCVCLSRKLKVTV